MSMEVKTKRILSYPPEVWGALRTEFLQIGTPMGRLARRYGMSKSTVYERAEKEHWREQRELFRKSVNAPMVLLSKPPVDIPAEAKNQEFWLEHHNNYASQMMYIAQDLQMINERLAEKVVDPETKQERRAISNEDLVRLANAKTKLMQEYRELLGIARVGQRAPSFEKRPPKNNQAGLVVGLVSA